MNKIFLFLIIFTLSIGTNAFADNYRAVDSLLKILNSQTCDDTTQVKLYAEIAYKESNIDPQLGLTYSEKGVELALKIDDKKGLASNYNAVGVCYFQKAQYTKALEYYFKTLAIAEEIGLTSRIGKAYANIGRIYFIQLNLEKSNEYYRKALEIAERYNDTIAIVQHLINLGGLYLVSDSLDVAINFYNRAEILSEKQNFIEGITKATSNLGVIFERKGKYDRAYENFKQSYELYTKMNNKFGILSSNINFADLFLKLIESPNEAQKYQNFKEFKTDKLKFNFLKFSSMSIKLGNELNALRELTIVYKNLSAYYKNTKNWEKAFESIIMVQRYQDSISIQDSRIKILQVETQREYEVKDKEIVILTKDKENQRIRLNLMLVVIIFVVIIAVITFLFFYKKRKDNIKLKEQNIKIIETTEKLEHLNKKLWKKEKILIKTNATKDRFFAIISHDLRTPIYSFNILAKILSEYYIDLNDEQRKAHINTLENSSKNIVNLLDNLLAWSQLQNNKNDFFPEKYNLLEIINEEIKEQSEIADLKNISLKFIEYRPFYVYIDKYMIKTTLRNIISNAIKFSNPNSVVEIFIIEQDNRIIIEIKDTGIGISEEDGKKLFKIDVKHSTYGTAKEKGTGLGLILCKEFVEKNKGVISFISDIEKGTSFFY